MAVIDRDSTNSRLNLSSLRLILVPIPLYLVSPAVADHHRNSITGQERPTARDLLENRSEDLSGREVRLLRDIRSGSKDELSRDERDLFDRIQRKLPDGGGQSRRGLDFGARRWPIASDF